MCDVNVLEVRNRFMKLSYNFNFFKLYVISFGVFF